MDLAQLTKLAIDLCIKVHTIESALAHGKQTRYAYQLCLVFMHGLSIVQHQEHIRPLNVLRHKGSRHQCLQ